MSCSNPPETSLKLCKSNQIKQFFSTNKYDICFARTDQNEVQKLNTNRGNWCFNFFVCIWITETLSPEPEF